MTIFQKIIIRTQYIKMQNNERIVLNKLSKMDLMVSSMPRAAVGALPKGVL